jgi:hypothetical protein
MRKESLDSHRRADLEVDSAKANIRASITRTDSVLTVLI